MKCGECDLWAHDSVQGMNAGRSSVTFVTKTGVAHLPSNFGNIIKLIIFCMSVLQYFSEVTPKLLV